MLTGKRSPHDLLLLCIAVLMIACNPSPADKKAVSVAGSGCDTTLLSHYRSVSASSTDPQVKAERISAFYNATPGACHRIIATPLTLDLFDIVYKNPTLDSLVLPFFEQLSHEEQLSEMQRGKALFGIAGYYLYGQNQPDRSLPYLQRARRQFPNMNDTLSRVYHSMMGQYMMQKANLKEAADHYLKTIALCEKLHDSASLAANYANYGTVFSNMGEYQKSIDMKQKAVAYFRSQEDYNSLFIGYVGIGVEYGQLRRYDSSMAYYQKAVALIEQGVHNPNVEFDLFISMAAISLGENKFEPARFYYSKARETLSRLNDPDHERIYVMASTPAFANVHNVDKEIGQIKSYIPGFYADNNIRGAKDAFYTLFHIYYLQDRNKEALYNYKIYDSLKSQLAREENKKYVAELETRYETQKKELKIAVQRKEIKQKNILNGLLLALLATVGLAAAFVITRIQLKRNRKEAELHQEFTRRLLNNTEEERGRIARDLHDGVSQELMILKQQLVSSTEPGRERIDAIINEIRMISRDLHPVMLDKIGFKASVEHTCNQMMEHHKLFISSDISYGNSLSKGGELQLFRMIQEALNNIIKYAGAEAARVTVKETDHTVFTEIIDNGKGFDVNSALNNKMSFGLLSLTERSRTLQGKTDIQSSAAGTVIKIEIPRSYE